MNDLKSVEEIGKKEGEETLMTNNLAKLNDSRSTPLHPFFS